MHVCAEGRARTVLVIGSAPEIVALLDYMLRALGCAVVQASSVNDAIRLVQAGCIDAVVADAQMLSGEDCASAFTIRETGCRHSGHHHVRRHWEDHQCGQCPAEAVFPFRTAGKVAAAVRNRPQAVA